MPKRTNAFLLGSPIHDESIPACLLKKMKALRSYQDQLSVLFSHSAFYLTRLSLAIPRLNYFLRCSPTWKYQELLEEYDKTLLLMLEKILNVKLSVDSYNQATLPVREGGLGFRQAVKLATPAFLASVNSVSDLIKSLLPTYILDEPDNDYEDGLLVWSSLSKNNKVPDASLQSVQSSWESPIFKVSKEILTSSLDNQNDLDKARLLGISATESGAWLNCIPSKSLGLHLENSTFRISMAVRLGSNICHPHQCQCGSVVNSRGLHGLSCRNSKGRIFRHSALNDIIKRAFVSAEIPAALEPPGLSRSDGKRPDGVTLVPWSQGKCLIWDATCVDTFALSYLNQIKETSGSAADYKE